MDLKLLCIFIFLFSKSYGSVVTDILKAKYTEHVSMFTCGSATEDIVNQKAMFDLKIKSTFNNYYQMRQDNINTPLKSVLVLNDSCENWTQVLDILDLKSKYKVPKSLLIITRNISNVVQTLLKYPIEVDSDVTIVGEVEENYYQLYEVYNSGFYTGGSIHQGIVGAWNNSVLDMSNPKRTDMRGVVLKCMVVVTQPIVKESFNEYLDRSRYSSDDSLHKLKYFTLLKYLQDMYKFSYKLYRTNSWGYPRNGSFDGMAGALQRHEVDLGGSPVFIRADRAKILDYTTQIWESRPCFMFRHPKRPGAFYTAFTRPLADKVWFCSLAFLLLAIVALYAMLRMKWAMSQPARDADESLSMVILSILGAMCQQGSYIERSSASVRVIVYVIFIFTMILYQFYSASIVSTLLREQPKYIRNLQDLLNSPLKVGIENVAYNLDYFKRTTDPIARKLYLKIAHKELSVCSPAEGIALVKRGGYAFHVDSTTGYKLIRQTFTERETCELQEVQLYPPQKMIAVVRKGLPHRELLTFGLRKMMESGLMHRLKLIWDEPKPKCVHSPDSGLFAVNIYDFAMALVVLIFGTAISVVVLLCEIMHHKMLDGKQTLIPFRL